MSHTPYYDVVFLAEPAQQVIKCYRIIGGLREPTPYVTYTRQDPQPAMKYLTFDQRESWKLAKFTLGWR